VTRPSEAAEPPAKGGGGEPPAPASTAGAVLAGLVQAAQSLTTQSQSVPAQPDPAPAARRWVATYRLQLQPGFGFDEAAAVTGYLAELGVSHVYLSPCLQAARGSTSGYDVTDHSRLSDALGGKDAYQRLAGRLSDAGLGQLLDIVPNHMALAGRANAWWWDVLENGPSSRYASYFDIDWDPPERKLTATVLMPVLGDRSGRVLEAGELTVHRQGGSLVVRYHEHEAPLSPRSLDDLVSRAADRAGSAELKQLAADLAELPHAILTDPAVVEERHKGIVELRSRLASLCAEHKALASAIDLEIMELNRDPDALDELLGRQNYRLAYWGTAAEELSYRRFFNIEHLAGLRVENQRVFDDTHRLILQLVADGTVSGLRVDHVDGLADPKGYLDRLRAAAPTARIVVEKVLDCGEQLPASWPVQGTTGYDFLNRVTALFVDTDGATAIQRGYERFTGLRQRYPDVARASKLQIAGTELAAEVERLTALLADICEGHRRQRDYTRRELREALTELLAAFNVYRIYPKPGHPVTLADSARVATAIATARQRRPDLDAELAGFLGELLVLRHHHGGAAGGRPPGQNSAAEAEFAVRFCQLAGPVMAKGLEDTAFYRYAPLGCLAEVGGDPSSTGCSVQDFHEAMADTARLWPEAMLTLSTHDTKRSADVRARISVLSELPQAWERAVGRWAARNARHKKNGLPDRNAEYLLYQTLVGAWPIGAKRIRSYMAKAAREAKVHTSWADMRADYEAALDAFVVAVLTDRGFVADLEGFLAEHRVVERGRANSVAQAALLLTCPGVPDLYQGSELWDLSLVDPDNRRLVDYVARRGLLAYLANAEPERALALADDGAPKLWLIHRLLRHRHSKPAAYDAGSSYQPLQVTGGKAEHVVAFARTGGLAVVVPRLLGGLASGWDGTSVKLPAGRWASVLTGDSIDGGEVSIAALLRRFPVAVMGSE
jgi:(1->4)-alpha-D-glucan 1-alpha-D-glucosylmutase